MSEHEQIMVLINRVESRVVKVESILQQLFVLQGAVNTPPTELGKVDRRLAVLIASNPQLDQWSVCSRITGETICYHIEDDGNYLYYRCRICMPYSDNLMKVPKGDGDNKDAMTLHLERQMTLHLENHERYLEKVLGGDMKGYY